MFSLTITLNNDNKTIGFLAGSVLLILGAGLIRTYLRILDYSHSHSSKSNDPERNNLGWVLDVVQCLLNAGKGI